MISEIILCLMIQTTNLVEGVKRICNSHTAVAIKEMLNTGAVIPKPVSLDIILNRKRFAAHFTYSRVFRFHVLSNVLYCGPRHGSYKLPRKLSAQ